jgi:hypothetical protein
MSSEFAASLQDVMRAITLWPEWAGAIAYLDKRVENRTWEPPRDVIGTRIAIHAGAYTGGGKGTGRRIEGLTAVARMATRSGWQLRRDGSLRKDGNAVALTSLDARCGAILATAVVVGFDLDQRTGWDVPGQVHWRLDDVIVVQPVLCVGLQRVWRLDEQVRVQLQAK